ncbi:MAG TPA: SDR family NAD(P)-dependent oxidoreductase, partial [Burkholderiales bacterium]|nr:SDR family NAD(P)-dependent oxidoreductase [Burkholderiales bacterium]
MSSAGKDAGCAIVTGAAGGIGYAAAKQLASQGFAVFMVDMDEQGLRTACKQVQSIGARATMHVCDVACTEQVNAAVEAAAQYGRINALVNVAGGSGPKPVRDIEGIDDSDWEFVINLNLKSVFLFCRAVMPYMRAQRYGRIVNTSSSYSRGRKGPVTTQGTRLAYAAAKAGIIGFGAQLSKDVADCGITVNTVVPALTLGEPGSRIRSRFE